MLNFFLLRDDFESSKCCLDPWLSCMFDCIHVYVFLFFEKPFSSNLDSSSTPLDTQLIYRALQLLLIAISTPLNSYVDQLRNFLSPQQLLDRSLIHRASFCLGHLLDRCICRPYQISTPFDLSRISEVYKQGQCNLALISLDLSRVLTSQNLSLSLPTSSSRIFWP